MTLKRPNAAIERGAYTAIVYKDGDLYVAEDNVGTIIEENSDAATALSTACNKGGRMFICEGQYDIASQITLSQLGLSIMGEGVKTVLKQTADFNIMLNVTADNVQISSLKIDGNKSGLTTSTRNIFFSDTDYGSVNNCYLTDAKLIAIRGWKSNRLSIFNNIVRNTGDKSVYITNACDYVSIRNNTVQDSGHQAIMIEDNVNNSDISGNNINDAVKMGISLFNSCNHSTIGNNRIYHCALDNINIDSSSYATIVNNISYNSVESGFCSFRNVDYCTISNNVFYNNWHFGMNCDSLRYSSITGNVNKNNSGVGSGTWSGMGFRSTSTFNHAISNVITGNFSSGTNQKYGIDLEDAADDFNVVIGNYVRGNVSGGVHNPTSNSIVDHNRS